MTLSNPLDYHTYIWRDEAAMSAAWAAMTEGDVTMTLSLVDYPTTDKSDWSCATNAALSAHESTKARFGVVSTLPELMPEDEAATFMSGGIVPFSGLEDALKAVEAAACISNPHPDPVRLPGDNTATQTVFEAKAKRALADFGLTIPNGTTTSVDSALLDDINALTGPFVIKGLNKSHKSEHNAVALGVTHDQVLATAKRIGKQVLVEEMVTDGIAELLIGVIRDPAHGFVLTLGAGGVLTELMDDNISLLLPVRPTDVIEGLEKLRCYNLLDGYRGQPKVNLAAITDAVLSVQAYVLANADTVGEVEINPLICTAERAVAVDALIRKA
ncbi:MAG: hypothetical protein HKN18_12335 [Silicimonas sp.]|nr:hypothetical protein [Silicimonas sp.]